MSLWPEAEGAHRGTSSRGVQGYVGMVQEWNVVTCDVEVALVGLRHPRQLIEILNRSALWIMY